MGLDYQALKDELTAGHPVSGAYNADDTLAAAELNALNRPVASPASDFKNYCLYNLHRENNGDDTTNTNIYGRAVMVAEASAGSNPFGLSPPDSITVGQIAAAKTLVAILDSETETILSDDANLDSILTKCQGANVMSPADKTALVALSDNKQSRASEINFGRPKVNATHVATARAL